MTRLLLFDPVCLLGPVPDDLDDLADVGEFAFCRTRPQFTFPQTVLRAVGCAGQAVTEYWPCVQILKSACFDRYRSVARMVKEEQACRKLLKVDLVANNYQVRVFQKCFASGPHELALGALLEGRTIVHGLTTPVHDHLRRGMDRSFEALEGRIEER